MQTIIGTDARTAAELLRGNDLVALPTETVYGLAGNALSEAAVRKIFSLKGRPLSNPLIVHVDSVEKMLPFVSGMPPLAETLLDAFAPGPLTLLLPGNGRLPAVVNNGLDKLAFRIPAHPLIRDVLAQVPFPLVAPSANRFTAISPTTAAHVLKNFDGQIPYILDGGPCGIGIESTVVGFNEEGNAVLYRQGAVTAEMLEDVIGKPLQKTKAARQESPGMLPLHYAPSTPTTLVDDIQTLPAAVDRGRTGLLCFRKKRSDFPGVHQTVLSTNGNLEEAAKNLYGCLHYLDDLKLDQLFVEKLPNNGLGVAINDRLQKAAHK